MQKLIKAAVFTGVLAAGAANAATTTTTFAVTATVAKRRDQRQCDTDPWADKGFKSIQLARHSPPMVATMG